MADKKIAYEDIVYGITLALSRAIEDWHHNDPKTLPDRISTGFSNGVRTTIAVEAFKEKHNG